MAPRLVSTISVVEVGTDPVELVEMDNDRVAVTIMDSAAGMGNLQIANRPGDLVGAPILSLSLVGLRVHGPFPIYAQRGGMTPNAGPVLLVIDRMV